MDVEKEKITYWHILVFFSFLFLLFLFKLNFLFVPFYYNLQKLKSCLNFYISTFYKISTFQISVFVSTFFFKIKQILTSTISLTNKRLSKIIINYFVKHFSDTQYPICIWNNWFCPTQVTFDNIGTNGYCKILW